MEFDESKYLKIVDEATGHVFIIPRASDNVYVKDENNEQV